MSATTSFIIDCEEKGLDPEEELSRFEVREPLKFIAFKSLTDNTVIELYKGIDDFWRLQELHEKGKIKSYTSEFLAYDEESATERANKLMS